MPPRPANTSGHLHKKRRPVSIMSSRESSLSPSRLTWGSSQAYLPYHEEEYQHSIAIPHPHYQKSNANQGYQPVPDDLYGVPVIADQVSIDFDDDQGAGTRQGKEPYFKRGFRKESKQEATSLYPPKLAKMTVPERQELADQARRNSLDRQAIGEEAQPRRTDRPRHSKSKKSVSWHPDLGSPTASSAPSYPAEGQSSSLQFSSDWQLDNVANSVASDKTMWPFARKPWSLSDRRTKSSFDTTFPMDVDTPTANEDDSTPVKGFEFTPRIYVPLWKPTSEEPLAQEELPSTPQPSPSRHRRTMSICPTRAKPPTPASAPSSYPPAFAQPQLSPLPFPRASGSSAAGWPALPAFGSTNAYTTSSPYDHSMADLHQQQTYQAELGNAKVKWDPVDFRNGDVEASPSRTLRYAAEEWLRTR